MLIASALNVDSLKSVKNGLKKMHNMTSEQMMDFLDSDIRYSDAYEVPCNELKAIRDFIKQHSAKPVNEDRTITHAVLPENCPKCGDRLIHNDRGVVCGSLFCTYSRGGEPFKAVTSEPVKEGELLPCPFCGSTLLKELERNYLSGNEVKHEEYIHCRGCGSENTRKRWNTRPASAPKNVEGDYKKVLAALNDRRNSVTNVPSHRDYWDRIIEALDRIAARETHSITKKDLHMLKSILGDLKQLQEFAAMLVELKGHGLMTEIHADNRDWLDCFIDKHERLPEAQPDNEMMKLRKMYAELTNGDYRAAQVIEKSEHYDCPMCDGGGTVCGEQYINFDDKPLNVLFSGIGDEFIKWQKFFDAAIASIKTEGV